MRVRTVLACVLAAAPLAALAQLPPPPPALPDPANGFLCCNMRTDGSWISDSNYFSIDKKVIPLGTPVKALGYGRQRVYVEFADGKQAIGNDYSRNLNLTAFARRYIVAEDPRQKLAGYPPRIRKAIEAGRLVPGMTREQVIMAVGYPISSENPDLNAPVWRYWLSTWAEYQVMFGPDNLVKEIGTDAQTRGFVLMD